MLYLPFQQCHIYLNILTEGAALLYFHSCVVCWTLHRLTYWYCLHSKVNVQNPASLSSNPGKRVVACWEPSVIATIIIPSE